MIRDNAPDYEPENVRNAVVMEYKLYRDNPYQYIASVLDKGQDHSLFKIPAYVQRRKIKDRAAVEFVRREYKPLLKRIKHLDFNLNLKNEKGLLKGPVKKAFQVFKHPCKSSFKDFAKSLYLTANNLVDFDLYQRINEDCDWFKNAPSGRTHIDHYINWAKSQDHNQPHFACIHIDDIHNPEEFFTYDSSDIDLLYKEAEDAKALLDRIPNDYHGSLTHDL